MKQNVRGGLAAVGLLFVLLSLIPVLYPAAPVGALLIAIAFLAGVSRYEVGAE